MVRRAKFANGTPKPLPKPERNFQDKLNTLRKASRGLDPESTLRLFDYFIKEALAKGQLTEQQASGIYQSLPQTEIKESIESFQRENFSDGGMDFSGLSVPQLRLLYKRYTGVDGPSDSRQLIRELKRLIKGLDEDGIPFSEGGRAGYQDGLSVQTLDPRFPTKDPTSTGFKPLDIPAAALPPLAIGAGVKRIKDTFFSKEEDKDKKDIQPSDDKNNLNLKRGDDPGDPNPLDEITQRLLIEEAVNRLKKKEMNPDKRDVRTKLAVELDLPVTRSGMLEIRKGDYFNKRLETLKDKGVNFDGYYSVPEIANLLGTKSTSGINSYIMDNNIPTVKKGLFKVVKLNDFLDIYQGTKKRVDLTPPLTLQNLARKDFLDEDNRSQLFERFKRIKFGTDLKDPTKEIPAEIRTIYNKYDLSKIEGGHPFPVEFFTKKFGKKGTLKKERQFDWIYRNRDKLFNPNDLVLQSKDINQSGGPFYNAIGKLKPLYEELGQYVDKYEGKGAVKNKEDVEKISKLNLEIMKIIGNSKDEVQKFIEDNPDSKLTIPKMKTGGLHGAIFDYETGEVELYAPDKQVLFESGAIGDEPQDQKLKIAEGFLDVLNQVVDDKKDLAKLLDYFEGKMLPRFQKGGPVYGKYAGQIAKLP
jgi:hypothetical protein